jgi:hypothetical protein
MWSIWVLTTQVMVKKMACKGVGWEWSSGVTFHVSESVGECEGMNSHTPKWVSTLRVWILMDFQIFKGQL